MVGLYVRRIRTRRGVRPEFPKSCNQDQDFSGWWKPPLMASGRRRVVFSGSARSLMAARVSDAGTMQMGQPRELFLIPTPPPDKPPHALNYATWDGSRFLVRRARTEEDSRPIAILTNWVPMQR